MWLGGSGSFKLTRRLWAVARLLEPARALASAERTVVAPGARQEPETHQRVAVLVANRELGRGRAFEPHLNPLDVVFDRTADAGGRVPFVVTRPSRGRTGRATRLWGVVLRTHLALRASLRTLARLGGLVVGRRHHGVGARGVLAEEDGGDDAEV